MNWILGIAAALFGGSIGFLKSRLLTRRTEELAQTLVMMEQFQLALSYEKMDTPEMVEQLAQMKGLSGLSFLKECSRLLDQRKAFPQAWEQSICKSRTEMNLAEDDWSALSLLGGVLGGSDAQSQKKGLELISGLLEQGLQQAKKNEGEKGRFYRSLGVLGGIGMAILLL